MGGAQIEGVARIGRTAHHVLALHAPYGHGFAGQRRLVQQRSRTGHRAVHRGDGALPDQQQIARQDAVQRDLGQGVALMQGGGARDAGQQVGHLAPGAAGGKAFQERAARIHQRDDRRGQRFVEDQRGGHRQGGDDVQPDLAAGQTAQDFDQQGRQHRDHAAAEGQRGGIGPARGHEAKA